MDITHRDDIVLLVNQFYVKVKSNPVLGPIFIEVAELDFEAHLPIMYNFWASQLLGEGSYQGNPMIPHLQLAKLTTMGETQFNEWLSLFEETMDELFSGEKAEEAKMKAGNIARLMLHKINFERR